jgi:hypothetical protein
MGQPIPNTSPTGETVDYHALILSPASGKLQISVPPEVELSTLRQMIEMLLAKVETLQQNQAIQLAGVHDRLDAVELELPLIQEQGALRIRDLEARMSVEIDQATRSAVEEATAAVHEEVAGTFSSLAAQMEAQRKELSQMAQSKEQADTRLNRAILDIERLCGNLALSPLALSPEEEPHRPHIAPAPSQANPSPNHKMAALSAVTPPVAGKPTSAELLVARPAEATVPSITTVKPAVVETVVPGFDTWKRQFMREGESLVPVFADESEKSGEIVICPRCYSARTRRATHKGLDSLLRLAGLTPHRCRSCTHRFYKRLVPASMMPDHGSPKIQTQ